MFEFGLRARTISTLDALATQFRENPGQLPQRNITGRLLGHCWNITGCIARNLIRCTIVFTVQAYTQQVIIFHHPAKNQTEPMPLIRKRRMPVNVMTLKVPCNSNYVRAPWSCALASLILTLLGGCMPAIPRFLPMRSPPCIPLSEGQDLSHFVSHAQDSLGQYRRANRSAYRDSLRKLITIRKQDKRQLIKTKQILRVERGDRFPSILLESNQTGGHETSLRLDPPLRRHNVVSIQKVAISLQNTRVAVITKTRLSDIPLLLILDRRGRVQKTVRLSAYDILWSTDRHLIISSGTPQPDTIHLITDNSSLFELKRSTHQGQPLLLARNRSGKLFSIEERTGNQSTLTLFDSNAPRAKLFELQAPLAGSRCEHFNDRITCLSFRNNPHGDLIAFTAENPNEQTLITRGTKNSLLQNLDADDNNLVIFAREQDRSVLYVYHSFSTPPQRIPSSSFTSSFLPGPKLSPGEPVMISIRAPRSPTALVSLDELIALGASHFTKPMFCTTCREELLVAEASDGMQIPISLITPRSQKGVLIKAYGSYGVPLTPEYSVDNRALLESGVALAFVHVRGGGERGHLWHIEGSGTKKLQGMRDLILATKRVQAHLHLSADRTVGNGISAGGWLFIRTALEETNLFSAIIVEAPLIEPSLDTPHASTFNIDYLEWSSLNKSSYSTNLEEYRSAPHFPRVLASLPLRDSVVPISKTLTWLHQLACLRTPPLQDVIYIDPKGEHSHASSAAAQTEWEALKHLFVHSVLQEAAIEAP